MKRRDNITVNIFAYAAMEKRSKTFRDVIGVTAVDRNTRELPHAHKGTEVLLKSAVQFTWQYV